MQPYVPPHIEPPIKPGGILEQARLTANCIIKTWPQAMYEEDFYQPPLKGALYVMAPQAIREMLLDKAANFPQSRFQKRALMPIWRGGIMAAEEAEWRWQRRAAAAAFSPKSVNSIAPSAQAEAQALCRKWSANSGDEIEITDDLSVAAIKVMLSSLLEGMDDPEYLDRILSAGKVLSAEMGRLNQADTLLLPAWTRRFLGPTFRKTAKEVHRVAEDYFAATDPADRSPNSVVHLLAKAVDIETGKTMSPEMLKNNIVGFIAAGRDTTALTLAWTVFLLANVKEVQEKVYAEILKIAGDEPVSAELSNKLTYTQHVIWEAMRLYPPGAMVTRDCMEDTDIMGRKISGGSVVLVPIYAIHRHRKFWDDPDVFDPDRFHASRFSPRDMRFSYMPFGIGNRVCLGRSFAMVEAVVLLAEMVRRLRFKPAHDADVEFENGVFLRPKNGLWVIVENR